MKKLIAQLTGRKLAPAKSTDIIPATGDGRLPNMMSVGVEIPVGQFFWIDTCIGMADNARHGQRVRNEPCPGSADVDCKVRILDIKNDCAVVVLLRPTMPFGAPAPHGTIFLVPVEVLKQWLEMNAHRHMQEQTRAEMRRNLGSVWV